MNLQLEIFLQSRVYIFKVIFQHQKLSYSFQKCLSFEDIRFWEQLLLIKSKYKHTFSQKSQVFGLVQTNWAKNVWGIWGIFGRIISTHFGTVGPLFMFSINQPVLTKPLYPHPKYLFGIGI